MKHNPITFCYSVLCIFLCGLVAADEEKKVLPKIEGRTVYAMFGKVVVFPEGVEKATEGYKRQLGKEPIALLKEEDSIIAEIYALPLNGLAKKEAAEMASSADSYEKVTVSNKSSFEVDGKEVESVTLRMDLDSRIGRPWIFESLYFPMKNRSVTFKMVTAEKDFEKAGPYLRAMLFLDSKERKALKDK